MNLEPLKKNPNEKEENKFKIIKIFKELNNGISFQ